MILIPAIRFVSRRPEGASRIPNCLKSYWMTNETIEVSPEVAKLFHEYKELYEKHSGEEVTNNRYLLRLINHDEQKMRNYLKVREFDLK